MCRLVHRQKILATAILPRGWSTELLAGKGERKSKALLPLSPSVSFIAIPALPYQDKSDRTKPILNAIALISC